MLPNIDISFVGPVTFPVPEYPKDIGDYLTQTLPVFEQRMLSRHTIEALEYILQSTEFIYGKKVFAYYSKSTHDVHVMLSALEDEKLKSGNVFMVYPTMSKDANFYEV